MFAVNNKSLKSIPNGILKTCDIFALIYIGYDLSEGKPVSVYDISLNLLILVNHNNIFVTYTVKKN